MCSTAILHIDHEEAWLASTLIERTGECACIEATTLHMRDGDACLSRKVEDARIARCHTTQAPFDRGHKRLRARIRGQRAHLSKCMQHSLLRLTMKPEQGCGQGRRKAHWVACIPGSTRAVGEAARAADDAHLGTKGTCREGGGQGCNAGSDHEHILDGRPR